IGYSDGLVEPENAYGEEFGVSRLEAAAQRVRQATPKKIAESLMTTAEEWSGSPEQADDMTGIVVKLKGGSGGKKRRLYLQLFARVENVVAKPGRVGDGWESRNRKRDSASLGAGGGASSNCLSRQ